MKCTKCEGRRVIVRTEPERWGSSRNWCYTGHEVERRYQCDHCNGSGLEPDSTPEVIVMGMLEIEGHLVDAPGFTRERFLEAVDRAKREQLRTTPANGCVLVMSGSDDARYAVTRERCECMAGQTHHFCKHRALCIYLQDVQGVDVMHVPTIGFNERGVSVTTGRRPAAKVEVA